MTVEVKVPQLPESVADATLVSWHKEPGQAVERDENLVDLETDKVVLEVPAPASGVIKAIEIENGATVTSGQLLAVLDTDGTAAEASKADGEAAPAEAAEKTSDQAGRSGAAPAATAAAGSSGDASAARSDEGSDGGDEHADKLSPSVRRLLEENDIDAEQVQGTGRGGRILKSDVLEFIETRVSPESAPDEIPLEPARAVPAPGTRSEERVPMSRLRARIAERMVEAQSTAAMLTTFNEVDLTEVIALRSRYRDAFEKEHGVKLGFMSFFIHAVIEALQRFPAVNASVEGSDIVYHDYYDVGIAVSSDRGLLVPVIRDADAMSFAELEAKIREYGEKARKGTISMDELTGGTFTITNGGVFGSMMSTPILNPPQSGILGMHAIQERAMVVDGEVVPRPMMYLALTYDHRIIDGAEAVQFLVAIKESLEDPGRLLLQI